MYLDNGIFYREADSANVFAQSESLRNHCNIRGMSASKNWVRVLVFGGKRRRGRYVPRERDHARTNRHHRRVPTAKLPEETPRR